MIRPSVNGSEIQNPVVCLVAVDVVDFLSRPLAMRIEPSESVRVVKATIQPDHYVSKGLAVAPSHAVWMLDACSHPNVSELPGFRVVLDEFFKA